MQTPTAAAESIDDEAALMVVSLSNREGYTETRKNVTRLLRTDDPIIRVSYWVRDFDAHTTEEFDALEWVVDDVRLQEASER
jgi:hypothetical protein